MRSAESPVLNICYLDNHLIVVNKPAGLLVQGDKTGDPTLFEQIQLYLKERFQKPGNVYLGMVHRLDRPVSGLLVFARTSKAAARLSDQFRQKSVHKLYRALVRGKIPDSGLLEDLLIRKGSSSYVTTTNNGKLARLSYRRLLFDKGMSLLEIELETGRHHQIRVQLAHHGFPVIGDFRYGSKEKFPRQTIALHAYQLRFSHPVKREEMSFTAAPLIKWPLDIKG